MSDEYKEEENKKKLLHTLHRVSKFYKLIGDKNRRQQVEKIEKYIQSEETVQPVINDSTIDTTENRINTTENTAENKENTIDDTIETTENLDTTENAVDDTTENTTDTTESPTKKAEQRKMKRSSSKLHKNEDLPPEYPRIKKTSSNSSVNLRDSLRRSSSRSRRRSITPAKVLKTPLDETYHLSCRFYAGNEEFNYLTINDYLDMNRGKLIRKVMRDLHFFFPFVGETILEQEFKETDKNIFATTNEIRYNFNRFIDSLLVGLGVRQIEDDQSMKWITDEVYPCYELKKIVLRMRDCLLQLFGTWIIYIENLNEIINNFNIVIDDVKSPKDDEDEDDEDGMNGMIDLRTTIVMRRNSVFYERLHPVYIFIFIIIL